MTNGGSHEEARSSNGGNLCSVEHGGLRGGRRQREGPAAGRH
jgi:hypothetical protein